MKTTEPNQTLQTMTAAVTSAAVMSDLKRSAKMNSVRQTQEAWKLAAAELGVEFVYPLEIEEDGKKTSYHGLIRSFGSANGTLIFASERFDENLGPFSALAKRRGFFFSCISAKAYKTFDREAFIEALKDWGWFGPASEKPKWL
jgi:hypothetical protein